ncbi:MAG: DinB family protein [Ignavibacteria bacterium]|jgi:uncharacterized damage-inducible protein DinB
MYNKLSDFLTEWKYESEATLKIFNQLTDAAIKKKFNDNIRTPGRIAWHLVTTIGEMVQRSGLKFDATPEDAPVPATKKEICDEYKRSSNGMISALQNEWNDKSLNEEVNMYEQTWKKGTILTVLIKHQAHHRGQLTVVMRLAGLKVPGVYGPAKEEWANMGMEAQE